MPVSLSALNTVVGTKSSLTDLSVTQNAAGAAALAYDNAGAFSYTPPDVSTYIDLTNLQVLTAAASGGGALAYNNTNGNFTFTPADLSPYLTAETSHADVVVDGDFASAGIMASDGAGTYSIITDNSTNWNTAFSWGDHSVAGYLTAETTTSLAYTSGTQTLTFTDETGSATNIDLSGLLDDTNLVTSVNTQTGAVVLALTDLGITDGTSGQFLSTDGAGNFTFATAVTETATQTLTNKTITSPTLDGTITVSGPSRNALTTANSGSFDMNLGSHFKCTPTGAVTITFTNITDGQSGSIYFDNSSGQTVSQHASVKMSSADLTAISSAGLYWLAYFTDGTTVLVVASGSLV